ncbi:hypothetical protein ElyMa_002738100 [Elysia marginata]|uniref:SUEL-type lectin domain-containing protein n=1 Tax=Elysia marginata TaxID=1093978 RepID=A0AAV4HG42_9GAST|nr:hypothetical protein ElyMa_002738100 [Elysia marginata]
MSVIHLLLLPIHSINICQDEAHFRCEAGELISVVSTNCGPNGVAARCPDTTQTTISSMCSGQQTCSNSGVAALVSPDGCSNPIHVDYQCKKGSTSVCQTNICAEASNGLSCPTGHVIHVRHMSCLTSRTAADCPRSSYSTLFMCEGAQHCDASGLRALLPQLCERVPEDGTSRGVVVQYFCVPESKIDTSCSTGRFHRLKGPFGVIRPPRLDDDNTDFISFKEEDEGKGEATEPDDDAGLSALPKPTDTSNGKSNKKKNKKISPPRCKWLINPRNDVIEVRVHQLTSTISSLSSSVSSVGATASFSSFSYCPDEGLLSIKYNNCSAGNQTETLTLCDKDGILTSKELKHESPPLKIQSCGMIKLTSALPLKTGYHAAVDKLIISYHTKLHFFIPPEMAGSADQEIPSGISQCLAPPALVPAQPESTTTLTSDLQGVSGPFNDPAAPSSISKKFGNTNGEEKDKPRSSSSRFPKLKMFILYVVFGVLIVALLIALIVVIVSYRRISVRKTRARGDSGERTALWLYPRQDDTPLETFFQTNSLADGSAASMTSGSESSHRKVIASVHLEPDTTRTSSGSGLSTFSPGQGGGSSDRGRDSAGLKDLIDTFQSGTFPGYSSLRDLCGPARFSTGSLETRGDAVAYELTDTAPAVVGGVRHSYNEACDGGPLYVRAGSGQYADVTRPENGPSTTEQNNREGVGSNTSFNAGDHYASSLMDDPYAKINGGSLYSKPLDGGFYASPDGADYESPSSGHYDGIGGHSGGYESCAGAGEGHYESLPCADSNIYEAIGSSVNNLKQHRKHDNQTAAATTTPNHQQHPPVPPPLPAPVANGGLNHTQPVDDFHYRVNNDEYAMVMKPNRLNSAISSSKSSSANLGHSHYRQTGPSNGDSSNSGIGTDFPGVESPYSQISDQHWKRRSAPPPQNGGYLHGNPLEDVV